MTVVSGLGWTVFFLLVLVAVVFGIEAGIGLRYRRIRVCSCKLLHP